MKTTQSILTCVFALCVCSSQAQISIGGGDSGSSAAVQALSDALEAFRSNNQIIAAEWTMGDLKLPKVPASTVTTNEGTAFEYDWAGAPVQIRLVQGDATRTAVNAPTTTNSVWGPVEILVSDSLTNCTLSQIDGHVLFGRLTVGGVVPTEIAPDTVIFYQALYTPYRTWFFWRGNQDAALAKALGGTGNDRGIAAGAILTRTDGILTDRNVEVDYATLNALFVLMPTNRIINTTASRLSASSTNGMIVVEGLAYNDQAGTQHLGFNESHFRLGGGITNPTIIPAGGMFPFRLINFGPHVSNNVVMGYGGIAAAAAAPESPDYTTNLVAAWVMTNTSGNITDASGNGYTITPLGGTWTYSQAGDVESASIRNAADTSLVLTNPAVALIRGGADSFTVSMRVKVGDASANYAIAGVWDDATSQAWRVRSSSSVWLATYSTNAYGYELSSGITATTDWTDLALVYNATTREFRFLVDGVATSTTLNSPLNDLTVPLSIGGLLNSGAAYYSRPMYIERFAIWSDAKTTSFLQEVAEKPFADWAP